MGWAAAAAAAAASQRTTPPRSKSQHLCCQRLLLLVVTHGPSAWAIEGNGALPRTVDFLEIDFLERKSVVLADVVVSPSAYLVQWMRSRRFQLPASTFVHPNALPRHKSSGQCLHTGPKRFSSAFPSSCPSTSWRVLPILGLH